VVGVGGGEVEEALPDPLVELQGLPLDPVAAGEPVQPGIDRGEVVITDRYVDSTLAYQGAGRDLAVADLEQVARWATHGLRPNLTIVLDLAQEHGLSRFEGRDRIEMESLEFLERAREAFLTLAEVDPGHYLVIDARLGVEEIAERVLDAVRPLLEQAKRSAR